MTTPHDTARLTENAITDFGVREAVVKHDEPLLRQGWKKYPSKKKIPHSS